MPFLRHLVVVLVLLGASATTAEARFFRNVRPNSDIKSAAMVMAGTVQSVRVVKGRVPGPAGSHVAVEEYTVKVTIPITASKTNAVVRLRHHRLLPYRGPVGNGYRPVVLHKGHTYLFWLKRVPRGHLELISTEGTLVEVPRTIRVVARWRLRPLPPMATLVGLLRHIIDRCTVRCHGALYMLGDINVHRKSLRNTSYRGAYTKRLLRITASVHHGNTLNTAYTQLGRLRVRSVIPRIIAAASARATPKWKQPSRAVDWLQGFDKPTRIKAYRAISRRAKTADARTKANYYLRYQTKGR